MTKVTVKLDISTPKYPNTYTLIDADMYEELSKFKWYPSHGYCERGITKDYKRGYFKMHRVIMQAKLGEQVDHINGDKLDNRRCNLRICTHQENQFNKGLKKSNTSGYKGVSWSTEKKKWLSQIQVNKTVIYLGRYQTKEEAAVTYNIAARKIHKDFAYLNQVSNEADITAQIKDKVDAIIARHFAKTDSIKS